MENEVWKEIEGYQGRYEISSHGQVRSLVSEGLILKKNSHYRGYEVVYIRDEYQFKKKHFVHRLVALHFIENPDEKPLVNHIDRDKQHNHVKNLEWATEKENTNHWMRHEEQQKNGGEISPSDIPF